MWVCKLGVVLLVFLLSACGGGFVSQSLEDAVANRIIVPTGLQLDSGDGEDEIQTVPLARGDLYRVATFRGTVRPLVSHHLYFERDDGVFSGGLVELNQFVQAGDLLARQYFYNLDQTADFVTLYRHQDRMDEFEAQFAERYANRIIQMENIRTEIAFADSLEAAILALRLEILELQMEQFLTESTQQRHTLHQRLEELERRVQPEHLYAPVDGLIVFRWSANYGVSTRPTSPSVPRQLIYRVIEEHELQFNFSAPFIIFRYGTVFTVSMRDNTLIFEATVKSDNLAPVTGRHPPAPLVTLVPLDAEGFAAQLEALGLSMFDLLDESFFVHVHENLVRDALILPVEALRAEDRVSYVVIYEDGQRMKRYVTRGVETDDFVQILTGIEEGQRVVLG
jgi:multidrug efflux pump subunit AcrA (membrane-fusion protein)